jgi:hypothetical protein
VKPELDGIPWNSLQFPIDLIPGSPYRNWIIPGRTIRRGTDRFQHLPRVSWKQYSRPEFIGRNPFVSDCIPKKNRRTTRKKTYKFHSTPKTRKPKGNEQIQDNLFDISEPPFSELFRPFVFVYKCTIPKKDPFKTPPSSPLTKTAYEYASFYYRFISGLKSDF